MSQGDASFAAPLRLSLLDHLSVRLHGVTSPAALRARRQIRHALEFDDLDAALRHVDGAWRNLPDEAAWLAPAYGRLLALEGQDHDATLRLLERSLEFGPDPEVAALMVLTLLRLGRLQDARQRLAAALAHSCVEPGGLLCRVAGVVLRHPGVAAPGWIGRGPNLDFVGELIAEAPANALEIRLDGKPGYMQPLRGAPRAGARSFRFQPPKVDSDARMDVALSGAPLLGGDTRLAVDFSIDGRAHSIDGRAHGADGRAQRSGRYIGGWARLGWWPGRRLRLRVADEHGEHALAQTLRMPGPCGRWAFQISLRALGLKGNRIRICVECPDGRWRPLPDAPLLLERALLLAPASRPRLGPQLRPGRTGPTRRAAAGFKRARRTDIIIPVYRDRAATLACIESVLATLDTRSHIVVVDDATPDHALEAALDALDAAGRIELLRHPENQGFVAAVNAGLALHPTRDAVLLNSDTQVFGDWLARLRDAAYSEARVGTVTPLSNSGSIVSYPCPQGSRIDPGAGAALQVLAAATHGKTRVEIPVGVGFCLYVRRDCLRAVGGFDRDLFDRGYGEETDFCLRARRCGWSHRLAADVFVYHAGGLSFGARRAALLDRSQRLIDLRHPGYHRSIARFLAQNPLHAVRRRLDEQRLTAFDGSFVLIVTLALAGGVDRFVAERCREVRAQGLYPLVLRPREAGNARRCELSTEALEVPNLQYDIPAQLPALTALLRALRIQAIEIQHFLHLDARVIEMVRALPVPYEVFVHDYAWICPRLTLIDGTGRYCGEPPVSTCQSCVRRNGSRLGEAISVPALRARSATWLRGARRVLAPSRDTAQRLRAHFPELAIEVRPHTLTVAAPPLPPRHPPSPQLPPPPQHPPPRTSPQKRTRVALIGAIGGHKGYRVLLACARDARARRLPLDFIVVGYTEDDAPLLETGRVSITGRYTEAEAPHLLRRQRPDAAWFPSVWPETWCYALDHALPLGLPVLAFDLGAIAERLRAAGLGELLPLGSKPATINDRLLALAQSGARYLQTSSKPPRGDVRMGREKSADVPMNKTKSDQEIGTPPADEGLTASIQVVPLPPGLYLFSVQSAAAPAATQGGLNLPAVHVGLGPGVRSEQVEFIASPSTHGAWLFAQGDLLVTRINGTGATLILSSIRAPGGEVLSIKVERLDARTERAAAAGPAPAGDLPRTPGDAVALPIRIAAHVRTRGDMIFNDAAWAGRVGAGLWIESFAVRPLERFTAKDIEYKGLTSTGFETPWLSEEKMCGTKGLAVPLVGFAVRLKPSPASAAYDCEYSGYFQSGATVGPLRNGAPCRSVVANDPLEGLQVRLIKRIASGAAAITASAAYLAPVRRKAGSGAKARRPSTRRT